MSSYDAASKIWQVERNICDGRTEGRGVLHPPGEVAQELHRHVHGDQLAPVLAVM
jgi:hypothetical protein